jgi:penicillin-binding protein 1A
VRTTLDPKLQAAAEDAVRAGLREIDKRRGWRGPAKRLGTADAAPIEELIRTLDAWPAQLAAGDIVPAVVSDVAEGEATVRVGSGVGVLPVAEMRWVYGEGREARMKSPGTSTTGPCRRAASRGRRSSRSSTRPPWRAAAGLPRA